MNYYAQRYVDEYDASNVKVHFIIIEGIYEEKYKHKARIIGDINLTDNMFCKYIKQPYDVIDSGQLTITLNQVRSNNTYTLLAHLLSAEGYSQEEIDVLTSKISIISNDRTIKANQGCTGLWILI